MTKFLAVASAKGGVGKTTTALNLGTALTNFGKDVVIVDTNMGTPHISLHLGSPKMNATLNDSLSGRINIRDAAYLHPSGIRIIPSSISSDHTRAAGYGLLQETLMDLVGTTDLVLMDSPAGNEGEQVLKACDEVIVVLTPDTPSLAEAMKTIRTAEEYGKKVIGAIINRSRGDKFEMSANNIESLLEKPVLGVIPEDGSVLRSLALNHPVVYTHPESEASLGFKEVAAVLLGQEYKSGIN
ncbi:MAG: cell division ATPase MinD [Candidatus Woesearchaeota archaeon]